MPLSAHKLSPVTELLHGVPVKDSHRWLESRDHPQTGEWLREQSVKLNAYLEQCTELIQLEARIHAYLDVTVVDQPVRLGNQYFYRKRRESEEQGSIYVREAPSAEERLLVDPPIQEPFTSIGIHKVSEDGRLLAYEVKQGGEDRKIIQIIDVPSKVVLSDAVVHGDVRGFAFTAKGDGYFYVRELEAAQHEHQIRRHRFGQTGDDEVIFRAPRSKGSRLILIASSKHLGAIWFRTVSGRMFVDFSISPIAAESQWATVFREKPAPYSPILCHDRILVLGERGSSDFIVEVSEHGDELSTVVPIRGRTIRQCAITRNGLFVRYFDHGISTIEAWDFTGTHLGNVEVPSGGTINLLPSRTESSDCFFYSFQSFSCPPVIYEYSLETGTSTFWHQQALPYKHERYTVLETEFNTKDGTAVPVTLVSQNCDSPSAPQAAIMTSYGGFGMTMTPQFSVLVTIMLELGAVFVLPHIRGGGEFGKAWHEAGKRRNKQTAFDDFIAAAEWLHCEGITTPDRLGIFGGSHSGLLVAAAMTQRPDLFGAVLCIAPLIDMVRYEHFENAARWHSEFGTADDPDDLRVLYSYSPYHQVREDTNYPASLFVSGDKDDRCDPAHTRKMVARLQERSAQSSPVILDYSVHRGHSPVLPLSFRVQALARRIAFLCRQLKIALPEGGDCETSCG
jgi:prolyl oligopeptidase